MTKGFLSITTALPFDTLLLASFSGTERLSDIYVYEPLLFADPDKAADVDPTALIGEEAVITMEVDSEVLRHFHGIVRRFVQCGRDERFVHFRAEIVPALWRLKATSGCRIFQDRAFPDVVKCVLSQHQVQFRDALQSTYTQVDYCVQYRESDFQFISRLLEQEGIFYFFEHKEDRHVMVLADHASAYQPCPDYDSFNFSNEQTVGEFDMVVASWEASQQIRPGSHTYRDHRFQMFDKTLEKLELSAVTIDGNQSLAVYDYPGEYAKRFNKPDQRLGEVEPEGEKMTRLRMEDEEVLGWVGAGSEIA